MVKVDFILAKMVRLNNLMLSQKRGRYQPLQHFLFVLTASHYTDSLEYTCVIFIQYIF